MGRARKPAAATSARSFLRSSSRKVVPDSQDESLASDPPDVNSSFTQPSRLASGTFRGVFINPPTANARGNRTRRLQANSSPSTIGSPNSFTRDNSNEIETPSTAMTTPAESLNGSKSTRGKPITTRQRRGRTIADLALEDATENDEQLAREMQEEEYGGGVASKRATLVSAQDNRIFDLPDSDEDIYAMSTASEDVPLPRKRKAPAASSNALPRKARVVAQKALAPKRKAITDSEDDPALSSSDTSDSELSDFIDDEDGATLAPASNAHQHFQGESDDESSENDTSAATGRQPAQIPRYRRRGLTGSGRNRAEIERRKLETSHPEIKTMWGDLEAIPKIVTEEAEQPPSISRRLKGFQLEGLHWMIKQEQTRWRGGLLGDEMGMGKTIQAVSLIMSDYPAKQPTLVVVPPVALLQWTSEINDYTDGKLKVLVYHGTNAKSKKMSVKELKSYDVIMISYSGLESIHRKETKGWTRDEKIIKEDSAIHAIHFHRLILDEAHSIKSRTTGVAKACFALQGTYKWCLSGTPVQNRIGEFFSLLRFLNVQPFANYFCKSCNCSAIHWSVTPDYNCTHCGHRALEHVSVFNQEILNPIISGESDEKRKEALGKLRLLTDRIMLRRMKRDQTASMELPPKEVIVHNEFFGEIERDFSSSIMTNTTRTFDTYVSRGVMLNNYANIFGLIMQMRQVADHPDLLLKRHADPNQNVLVCNICDEPAEEAIRSRCKHEFCRACVKDYMKTCETSGAKADCPRCHLALSIDFEQPEIEQDEESVKKSSIINRIKMENWTSSTKIEMLVYDLYKLRSKKQTLKSIVFSQFTSMLQLIEWRLRRAGFNTVMLDGSMSPVQRQRSIEYFMKNTDVEVFLVSLKAGGVALNLTEASRVFIVDPWWNPAAEWQSADRCHRIGQKRPCVITRLCIEDSVESRIVMLQEKKAHLINGTVNGDEVAMNKLTPEDMQFLFRGS